MRNNTLLILPTANEPDYRYDLVVGIDLGPCRFATMVNTDGNVEIMGNSEAYNYCRMIESGKCNEQLLNVWLFLRAKAYFDEWEKAGVEAVYIGCCKGDYLALCGGDEEHPFYKYGVFEKFVDYLEVLCRNAKIHIETTNFDESYTSRASSINGDYIPNRGDENIPRFNGKRDLGLFVIDKHMVMNADVNAAINILHKAGFNIRVCTNSNLFEYVSLVAA